jgi:membrane fusion protein, multidrug efflux system
MLRRSVLFQLTFLFLVFQSSCDSKTPEVAAMPPAPVSVSQPIEREVIDYDDYEGRVAAVKTVEVRARVQGQLTKVFFTDGQMIKQGDQLFQIDPRPYQALFESAKAHREAANASLALAKSEYARITRLVNSAAASREELETWRAKQGSAVADRQGAEAEMQKAQLDIDFCDIRAPISGRISRTLMTEGNLVNPAGGDSLLTTIVAVNPMYVYFDVDERALLRYRREYAKVEKADLEEDIKKLKIPFALAIEGDNDYSMHGTIDFVDNRVSRGTGTIQVRGVLNNVGRLLDDGLRARVRVPVSDPYKALLITDRAISSDQTLKYVYVVSTDNIVERRDVVPDRMFDGLISIKSGLTPREWVIVNGILRVRAGAKVDPKPVPMPGAGALPVPVTSPPAAKPSS